MATSQRQTNSVSQRHRRNESAAVTLLPPCSGMRSLSLLCTQRMAVSFHIHCNQALGDQACPSASCQLSTHSRCSLHHCSSTVPHFSDPQLGLSSTFWSVCPSLPCLSARFLKTTSQHANTDLGTLIICPLWPRQGPSLGQVVPPSLHPT